MATQYTWNYLTFEEWDVFSINDWNIFEFDGLPGAETAGAIEVISALSAGKFRADKKVWGDIGGSFSASCVLNVFVELSGSSTEESSLVDGTLLPEYPLRGTVEALSAFSGRLIANKLLRGQSLALSALDQAIPTTVKPLTSIVEASSYLVGRLRGDKLLESTVEAESRCYEWHPVSVTGEYIVASSYFDGVLSVDKLLRSTIATSSYLEGHIPVSLFGYAPLFIDGYIRTSSGSMPLYTKSEIPVLQDHVPLYLMQETSGLVDSVSLYTFAAGTFDGALLLEKGIPLYVERDGNVFRALDMFTHGHAFLTEDNYTLYVKGGQLISSGIPLVISTVLGETTRTTKLYIHGI